MEIISRITDNGFGIKREEKENLKIRLASRGIIVIRKDGKIAVQNKVGKKTIKLIGGWRCRRK